MRRSQLVVLLGRARHQLYLGAEDVGDIEVAGPVRDRERDLVAFIKQCFGEIEQHILGPDPNRKVLALVTGKTTFAQVREEGIEQVVAAAIRAILATVSLQRSARSVVHVFAGQKIRHPDRETDDVATGRLQLSGLVGHSHDRARLWLGRYAQQVWA